MRWVDLTDDLPRLDVVLSRFGTSSDCLIIDICDVPELAGVCARLTGNPGALLRLALEEFGDKGRPQPTERRLLGYDWDREKPIYTHEFGQLPRLPDTPGSGSEREVKSRRGRRPSKLEAGKVAKAEAELKERRRILKSKGQGDLPPSLTQTAIATRCGLNRDRIRQLDDLMDVGWPLGKNHPEFPPEEGYVYLPTQFQAAQFLALS